MKLLRQGLTSFSLLILLSGSLDAQPFWSPIGGPEGASVRSIAGTSQGNLLVATDAGMYRYSTSQPNYFWPYIPFWDKIMSIVPIDGNTIACTDAGLYINAGMGENWVSMDLNKKVFTAAMIDVDLLAGTDDGVYRFAGDGWEPLGLQSIEVRTLMVSKSGHWLTGTDHSIMRSTNSGASWSEVKYTEFPVTAMVMSTQGHLYAGTLGNGVFFSNDGGNNWYPINASLGSTTVNTLAINNQDVLYAGTALGMFRTYNEGDEWLKVGSFDTPINAIVFQPPFTLAGTTGEGMFVSLDEFTTHQAVLKNRWALELHYTQVTGDVLLGTESGIYRYDDDGDTWEYLDLQYGKVWSIAQTWNTLFAGTDNGGYVSDDYGQSWTPLDLPYSKVWLSYQADPDAFPGGGALFATGDAGVFVSTDDGQTWFDAGFPVIAKARLEAAFTADAVFVASEKGIYRRVGTNGPWEFLGLQYGAIHDLAVSPYGVLFVAADDKLFRSDDNGDTWDELGLGYDKISSLTFNEPGHIFAGAFGDGVLRSTDGGDTWTLLNDGLDYPYVRQILVDPAGYLYAGTAGGGVYRSSVSTATREETLGARLDLWPNPTRDAVRVSCTLNAPAPLRTQLLAPDGRVLRSMELGDFPAGTAQFYFQVEGLPAGVYHLRLQAGPDQAWAPVIVLR